MSRKNSGLADDLYDYMVRTTVRDDDILRRLRAETLETGWGMMQIAPDQGQLMALLTRLTGARQALEIGVFTGYSSLCVARALGEGGTLVALDVSEEWTAIARRYWIEAGVADRVDLRLAPAAESLEKLCEEGREGSFDIAFIDADKENYGTYYEHAIALVRRGGLILIDNVLWGGAVIDGDDQSPDTRAIRAINDKVGTDDRVDMAMVPTGDGLTIARKR